MINFAFSTTALGILNLTSLTQGLSDEPINRITPLPVSSELLTHVTWKQGVTRASLLQSSQNSSAGWYMQCHIHSMCIAAAVLWQRRCEVKHQLQNTREAGTILIFMKTRHINFHMRFMCKTDKISFNSAPRRGLRVQEQHRGTDSSLPLQ